jgi:hypothetical protein
MAELFGTQANGSITFSDLPFSGPIAYMDLRGVTFRHCKFDSCQWMNCEAGSDTRFLQCSFEGRFVQVQSAGLQSAVFDPLNESNVDDIARVDIEELLGKPGLITINRSAVLGMLTSLLGQFRAAGFFTPGRREEIRATLVGPSVVREYIIERLVANRVLETDDLGRFRVVKRKHPAEAAD